jgi:ribosomal protein S18 acetylase RimI-like enzyme
MLTIRKAEKSDIDDIWAILHEIVSKGDTYAFPPETSGEEALEIWMERPNATYVAELDGRVFGTYFIKPNQPGLGAHVCNCGYMVTEAARGQGVGTAMCLHSQVEARRMGFLAMQFNFVVSTNTGALRLWEKLGFNIVGTLPKAFNHKRFGLVDAHVMFKWLVPEPKRTENPEDLFIRSYQPGDTKPVIDLWRECNLLVPHNNPLRDIERKLRVNPEWFLVGLLEGKLVATCMAGYEGHRGWINYLAVSPPCRRQSIGRRMMQEAERLLKKAGCPKINLQVRESNSEVIRFYERIGYSNDHVLSMGKRLKADPPYAIDVPDALASEKATTKPDNH